MIDKQLQHLNDIKEIQLRRLHELEKQAALMGSDTPPHILIQIEDLRTEITNIDVRLSDTKVSAVKLHRLVLQLLRNEKRTIVGLLFVFFAMLAVLVLQPYNIRDVSWCINSDQSTRVIGQLARNLPGSFVSDKELQIKIFEVGQKFSLNEGEFTRTNVDGTFSVQFPPPAPDYNRDYLINVVYPHDYLVWTESKIVNYNVNSVQSCP